MGAKFPHADHLLDDEIDYELKLRNFVEELGKDLKVKQRLLRRIFLKDAKENREYRSPYSIDQEFELIASRVNSIRCKLAKTPDIKLVSRLKHYYWRVQWCNADNEEALKMKELLFGNISNLLAEQNALESLKNASPDDESLEETDTELSETEKSGAVGGKNVLVTPLGEPQLTNADNFLSLIGPEIPHNTTITGATRKRNLGNSLVTGNSDFNRDSETEQMRARIAELEAQIQSLTVLLTAPVSQNNPSEQVRNEGHDSRQQNYFEVGRTSNDDRTDGGSERNSQRGNQQFIREDRGQYDRKIEKWNLHFGGDSRSTSLEDFIYKVKVLASMNRIPDNQLLSNIHLLLRGDASNWFFTYYQPSWTWSIFETRIRFRFGNPNQDQGNRQRIYDRKQQKGETFIAFVTEIERLNKLLTKPLSNHRKFEIVWENMRPHYRSKLACFSIRDLDQLVQVNYRIDANDPSLHPIGPKYSVHNIENQDVSESEDEEVNAIGRRPVRNQHQETTQNRGSQDLLQEYHVTHWRTPNYHPQVNDAERVNRVLTTAIRASIKKDHKDWANNIQIIANAIRNSVHEATRYSPYFIMFGRNMVSDGREYRHLRDNAEGNEGLVNTERDKLYKEIRENLKKAFEKHSRYYNLRANANCPTFELGEKLLKKNTELSDKGKGYCAKLAPKYIPAIVKRKVGDHCYELEDEKGKRLGIYNCRYLKKLTLSSK
ncbi:uncharacterized protein LOC134286619 [Aedes albopictus]|uniref:Retrotransposon gag domain-containing protein n=1 Tax=Aedes albopictus TaxID=7160 RepID=A0ABM1XZ81_AEDAL